MKWLKRFFGKIFERGRHKKLDPVVEPYPVEGVEATTEGDEPVLINVTVSPDGGAGAATFLSASVNTAGTEVALNFTVPSGTITGTWQTDGLTVKTNGHRISLASASESADVITCVIDTGGPIIDAETVTVSYDGSGNWAAGGFDLTPFSDQACTNNSAVSADTTYTESRSEVDDDFSYTSGVDHIVDSYVGNWTSSYAGSGTDWQYPVTFRGRGGADTTVIGLRSFGHAPLDLDWEFTYNTRAPRDNTANIMAKDNGGGKTTFRGCYVSQGWDAFRINSNTGTDTFLIEGCYVDLDRDDFIEADDNCAGTVRDCLFDGGFAGISFTTDVNTPGTKQIECVGVLSRLTPYLYKGNTTHFGPAVKLSSDSMNWTATDCVFAIEKPDHSSSYIQLGWDKLINSGPSDNNYLLNLSDTNLAGSYPLPPTGWTVLQGPAARAYWETAKAAWLAAHGF